ncbi:MAG: leucine-rich repeat domain-containing protein [Bacilli bacterium]|nr:leucine-rich repeat domain-containing protein [Bacilli bacterium]
MKNKIILTLSALMLLSACGGGSTSASSVSSELTSSEESTSIVEESSSTSSSEVSSEDPNVGTYVEDGDFTLYYEPAFHGLGLSITAYKGSEHKPILPTEYNEVPVVEVAEGAFLNNKDIASIVIPSSILLISDNAFAYCPNLIALYIPETVTNIGEAICLGDEKTRIYFELSQKEVASKIEDYDFDPELLKGPVSQPRYEVSIKPEVVFQDDFVFLIDDKVKEVANYLGSNYVSDIEIPTSYGSVAIDTIGIGAFKDLIGLVNVTIPEGYLTVSTSAFEGDIGIKNLSLPSTLTKIYSLAFSGCSSLEEITLPDALTRINWWSFSDCTSLKTINFGENITDIGHAAFQNCALTKLVIPDSVTTIDERAFSGNSNLSSVILGSGLLSLADNAFYDTAVAGDKVFYKGTAESWVAITDAFGGTFSWKDGTTTYFYSETTPETEGNYWHFDENNEPVIYE